MCNEHGIAHTLHPVLWTDYSVYHIVACSDQLLMKDEKNKITCQLKEQ